ncbi:MAG: DUF1553 domain-containing protein [Isosphaeraceae bacterium]|nr:DUF1553 domain-containing protein [Isosphaeraceae bacterium]
MHTCKVVRLHRFSANCSRIVCIAWFLAVACVAESRSEEKAIRVDFNRDIKPILSNNCFLCHGPDAKNRKGSSRSGLRLDLEDAAKAVSGGLAAIVPGKPEESELIARIASDDPEERMPPPSSGKKLTTVEVDALRAWIADGAKYAPHWSYVPPRKSRLPDADRSGWTRNPIDGFIYDRLKREGLEPTAELNRYALIRRVSLDLTGLPPTVEEADAFANDPDPAAYDRLVARLLASPAFGEHWARIWLDLARYADSAGYADDPPRTIWAYRDYVIRAFDRKLPFDRFTVEQIAGDLLPNPTEVDRIATAFHRNTLTNNEGGTNDEEFRNVAVVDRVNTTLAVWMGTTIACAQCHDHKYDPLSQRDYFGLFAFFNNTEDADRRDESPLHSVYSDKQKERLGQLAREIAASESRLANPPDSYAAGQPAWEARVGAPVSWIPLVPTKLGAASGTKLEAGRDAVVTAEPRAASDVYTLEYSVETARVINALRLESLPDPNRVAAGAGHAAGNFVITGIRARVDSNSPPKPAARYVRVELPGKNRMLSLAEVRVFRGLDNLAQGKIAKQSSTAYDGPANLAVDGNTDGRYEVAKSTTHTAPSDDPWWEVDLGVAREIDRVEIWNRTDGGLESRLSDFRIVILDADHQPLDVKSVAKPPRPSSSFDVDDRPGISFKQALADHSQPGFPASSLIGARGRNEMGWAVGGQVDRAHRLTVIPASPVRLEAGERLVVVLEQRSGMSNHTLGRFRVSLSEDAAASTTAGVPEAILRIVGLPYERRSDAERAELRRFYLKEVAPEPAAERLVLAKLREERDSIKPMTTVPILRELEKDRRRVTRIQHRGNFEDLGAEVDAGVPAVFPPLDGERKTRLELARWLVSDRNPLTARVIVNRYWEQLFGIGLVATSEEFGSQGELPTHPELLDWLASEFVDSGWDTRALLELIVQSATYRQDSLASTDLHTRDPENRLLARGPRFRSSAEEVRDQALAIAGLLSRKRFGPPVKPPQPSSGLSAAFGSMIDWETSRGEDRYRRAIYTTWRRSNPYPSMAAFDAPSREFCTLRRTRTNTPLQALVTLNDPVYIEAAQALARRAVLQGGSPREKATRAFRICLTRPPEKREVDRLLSLHAEARVGFDGDRESAVKMATDPLGPLPAGQDAVDLAAWTVVANVLLNLDETLMKR